MKTLKLVLAIIAGILVVAVIAGLLLIHQINTRAIPDYNQDVDLDNLTGEVEVFRDSLGIPHVYAENELDLYRVVGYLMAQDRLWQMDLLRRVTTGRLSEVLDPGLVEVDQLFRALQFGKKSERVLANSDPFMVSCIEAFTDGVNQFIGQHEKNLPFEFAVLGYKPDPWEPVHTANMIGYMAWSLTSGWDEEMGLFKLLQVTDSAHFKALLPDLDLQQTFVYPDSLYRAVTTELKSPLAMASEFIEEYGLQVFRGSNNWAVSGARSETGKPLMSNDMHLGLMSPGIWYQMHQVVKGKLDVTGVVLPGAPYVICGHNEDIAWGMTNVTVDDLDFYLETINPSDSNQYLLDGQWRDMELVEESIKVKGRKDPVVRINRYTHRGPVVSTFKGVDSLAISAAWQGRAASNELRTVHLLDRASGWDEFRDAVRTFTSISQNIVYADRSGNIGLQCAAGIPIRKGNPILIYPGDTSLYDWQGIVPFKELPFLFNPPGGYVSSANNRTVGDAYPYYIGTWYSLPSRIDRIREMLSETPLHGTESFKRMLRDQHSVLAREFTPVYLEALTGQTIGIYEAARKELAKWDYDLGKDSPSALIFEVMWQELHKAIFMDELGPADFRYIPGMIGRNLVNRIRVTGRSIWCDDVTTPDHVETFQDNIRTAFTNTVDTLASRFGNDPSTWKWGDLHTLILEHPLGKVKILDRVFKLNRGPFPVGGSFHTVCPYSYPWGTYIANHGASERHIFNTADWDRSLTVIPTGTSGVPASEHYLDQTGLYIHNQYHPDPFSRDAVMARAKYRCTFR